jgi:sulfide:quinone oxidoreductase
LSQAGEQPADAILSTTSSAGYNLETLRPRLGKVQPGPVADHALKSDGIAKARHDVVIVGGGAAGIATAASLLARDSSLDIAIIEPREEHYYQPGWTMVGGGIFTQASTRRSEASVMPSGVHWIKSAVRGFRPDDNLVDLEDGQAIAYRALVVAPGIMLDWEAIPGLRETLGRNGVTSNYSYETAPYTWDLVQRLKGGTALFTQPRCRSNAPGHRKRQCTCPAITGSAQAS